MQCLQYSWETQCSGRAIGKVGRLGDAMWKDQRLAEVRDREQEWEGFHVYLTLTESIPIVDTLYY